MKTAEEVKMRVEARNKILNDIFNPRPKTRKERFDIAMAEANGKARIEEIKKMAKKDKEFAKLFKF